MENRLHWNEASFGSKPEKKRHTFQPKEFFGDAIEIPRGKFFVPERGFRVSAYTPSRSELVPKPAPMPIFSIAAEQSRLFDLFTDLLEPLGDGLSVALESTHDSMTSERSRDYWSDSHDAIFLQSTLLDYEELLINDGCTGISVVDEEQDCEVMFTEDKSIHCYGNDGIMGQFQRVLHRHDVLHRPKMKMLSEKPHIHRTTPEYCEHFHELVERIGAFSY